MAGAMRYRKKPVVIEALRWDGKNWNGVAAFIGQKSGDGLWRGVGAQVAIETLEGEMRASPGDWIIRGVKGEFYPCKPDIFEATYEAAE